MTRTQLLGIIVLATLCSSVSAEPPVRSRAMDEGTFVLEDDGAAIDGQHVADTPPPRRLRLAILPDRTTGRSWGIPYLEKAIEDLSRLRPDAVFCVGDLIQGYTRDPSQWDREAAEYLQIVNDLDCAFYPTAGNHDVISGSRDSSDRTFLERYRETFGPVHYSVEINGSTMVILFSDETLDGGDIRFSDEQLAWLEGVLESAAQRDGATVLLMHRPLWRYGKVKWDTRVHPMLVEHGVDAVIAGHFHALHREPDRDGIQYHLLGVCGGAIDQHPLTGQLHHVTMMDLGPGDEISLFHLPVGVTLPDDFITRADQDRVYKIKRGYRHAEVRGDLPDPFRNPVDDTVEMVLRNPIDRAMRFDITPARPTDSWSVGNLPFIANTPADIRNPSTTDFDTPFELTETISGIDVGPGEEYRVELRFVAPKVDAPPPPPQLTVTATYEDDKGRRVPVILQRRIPIKRTVAEDEPLVRWPISAWRHSVYEVPEEDSWVQVDLRGPHPVLDVAVMDNQLCRSEGDELDLVRMRNNPPGDLVRIRTRAGDVAREFLLEPDALETGVLWEVQGGKTAIRHEAAWTREQPRDGEIARLRIQLPDVDSRLLEGLQVGVADNDLTYHTQWREVAPSGEWLETMPSSP